MGLWRFQIDSTLEHSDPLGRQVAQSLRDFGIRGVRAVRTARLYLIELPDDADPQSRRRIAAELLCDPVAERYMIHGLGESIPDPPEALPVEVHFKPGVMDNVANSTLLALADMGIQARSVRTARRYELLPIPSDEELRRIPRLLGNDCIQEVVIGTRPLAPPPAPPRYEFKLRKAAIRALDAEGLSRLSREGHLFLSADEMRAIQSHYASLGRDPTDLELETLAQTWSEHCVHKTLKSAIVYRGAPMPEIGVRKSAEKSKRRNVETSKVAPSAIRNPQSAAGTDSNFKSEISNAASVELRYANLLKDTIARATAELMAEGRGPQCLSVFKDNAGIIAFDDDDAIAFKVETHNHPSAIEPSGGAATGVGGVIRDVLGCGLGAKPVANTDVFCLAPPDWPIDAVPRGVIHPRTVFKGVVAGVRDYGNCMGIPTVNGAVHFDPRYLGNPLVFCGCIGRIPRSRIEKRVRPGDVIVVMGGRTGRDGIHGATFSSAELTDTHEDEFAHAVQIGSPIEEKKVLDVVLRARDYPTEGGGTSCLFSAITDCGAGGLSSAVGEMAAETGGEVDLEKVPLKYEGLRYDEIWISESQERMVLAVPPENLERLLALAKSEDVEATPIGRFTDSGRLVVRYGGQTVGDLDLHFLHEGIPQKELVAEWSAASASTQTRQQESKIDLAAELLSRLSSPTVASKHWLVHQYDHEVQSGSVVKPLAGWHEGPSDAAVVRPKLTSDRGIAIGCGLCPERGDIDPYWMAVCAIDEALRNVVCVGGDPTQTAILDNFCWPRVDRSDCLGALVRTCQACYDTAKAYGLPFISGKDSLNNEFALDPADVEKVVAAAGKTGCDLSTHTVSSAHPAVMPRDNGRPAGRGLFNGPSMVRDGRIAIPYTLLISAVSLIDDIRRCVTMDLKQPGAQLYLIGQPTRLGDCGPRGRPLFDLRVALQTHLTVARMIREGLVSAVHDVSDGGLLVAIAEMCLAAGRSCSVHGLGDWFEEQDEVSRSPLLRGGGGADESPADFYFDPFPATYVVEVVNERLGEFERLAAEAPSLLLATTDVTPPNGEPALEFETWDEPSTVRLSLTEIERAWKQPLDW